MTSSDLVVYAMCAGMIALGVVVMRRDRWMGGIAVALGAIGLLAYLLAEEGPPPEDTPVSPAVTVPGDVSSTPEG